MAEIPDDQRILAALVNHRLHQAEALIAENGKTATSAAIQIGILSGKLDDLSDQIAEAHDETTQRVETLAARLDSHIASVSTQVWRQPKWLAAAALMVLSLAVAAYVAGQEIILHVVHFFVGGKD